MAATEAGVPFNLSRGVQELLCSQCGYTETYTVLTHIWGPNAWCSVGAQCQECVKIVCFDSEPHELKVR